MRWSEFVPPFNIAVTGARNTVELMTVTSYNETVVCQGGEEEGRGGGGL